MDDLINVSLYADIKSVLEEARNKVYSAANSAMVLAYWNIGKLLFEASGENERSAYGKNLLGTISKQLTEEFGKGFTEANLRNMRQFFLTFPNCNALRSELSWTQYRTHRLENREADASGCRADGFICANIRRKAKGRR